METLLVQRHRKGAGDRDSMEVLVIRTGLHRYDSPGNATQGERAIYARPVNGGRAKWYVGYGSNYMPAAKADMANVE